MARTKTSPVPEGRDKTCGICAHAYGYCCPAADGRPISCRCFFFPAYLKMVSERACLEHFAPRSEPVPDRVTESRSLNLYADKVPKKVVPLFRKGEKVPWKYVDSDEIPPRGIHWDGTPFD